MKNILKLSMSFLLVAGFSSCLKDKTIIGPDSPGAIKHIIEFKNPAPIASGNDLSMPTYVLSYDLGPTVDLDLEVSYSGGGGAPNDINVKVALDESAIDLANEEQDEEYAPLSPSAYSIPSFDVVIPKGQKTGTFKVKLSPDNFDLSAAYALGFKIATVTGTDVPLSGNFSRMVLVIGAKNKLDGIYNYKSASNQSLNAGANADGARLITSGAYSVTTNLVNMYSNQVTYSFDPVTNEVTVANSGGIGAAITDPSSKFDPVTRTVYVKWKTSNRQFEETYTYIGPRP